MVSCFNCNGRIESAMSAHNLVCNGGSTSMVPKTEGRSEGIEQYLVEDSDSSKDDKKDEYPVQFLQQLFPDASISNVKTALEASKGNKNDAAEILLLDKETGSADEENDDQLMRSCFTTDPATTEIEDEDLSAIIARLAKQLTGAPVRLLVDESSVLLDALALYKNHKFDATCPLMIQFRDQPAIDVGGPKREFYTRLFHDIIKEDSHLNLVMFEGPDGRLMPKYSTAVVYSGILKDIGKMIAHAIIQCEIGFPFLSPAAYWYIVTGDISQAVCYCNITDVRDIEVAKLIQKLIDANDDDIKELRDNDSLVSLIRDAGCSELPTMKNKQLLIESLMMNLVLSKKKVVLDQLRNGLKTLNLLDEITKSPTVFEHLFINSSSDIDSSKVLECMRVSMIDDCATKDFLIKYINDCSKQDLQNLTRFITGSHTVVQGTTISVVLTDDEMGCILASTCVQQLHLLQCFESYDEFKLALDAVCNTACKSFNVS